MSKNTPMLDIRAVAERLAVSDKTVRRWIKSGDLVAHRLSGLWRVSEADLELFLHLRRGLNLTPGHDQ